MDIDTREAKQVTSFQKHVTSPILFSHQDKLLVTVDKNFAGDEPAYGYWVVDIDESDRRQWIEIEMSEEDDAP